jgi:hypothetical protein
MACHARTSNTAHACRARKRRPSPAGIGSQHTFTAQPRLTTVKRHFPVVLVLSRHRAIASKGAALGQISLTVNISVALTHMAVFKYLQAE